MSLSLCPHSSNGGNIKTPYYNIFFDLTIKLPYINYKYWASVL